jgi:hypothetical protein
MGEAFREAVAHLGEVASILCGVGAAATGAADGTGALSQLIFNFRVGRMAFAGEAG